MQIGFVLAPRINAAGRMGEADRAADLMLCKDPIRAQALARELCDLNRQRQAVEQEIYAQAIDMIEAPRPGPGGPPVAPGCGGHRGLPSQREIRLSQLYDPHFRPHRQGLLPQLGGL